MIRFMYVLFLNLFRAPFMLTKMRHQAAHPEKYSEEENPKMSEISLILSEESSSKDLAFLSFIELIYFTGVVPICLEKLCIKEDLLILQRSA